MKTKEKIIINGKSRIVYDTTTAHKMRTKEGQLQWLMGFGFNVRGYFTTENESSAYEIMKKVGEFYELVCKKGKSKIPVMFAVAEKNPNRPGYHANALLISNANIYRLEGYWRKVFASSPSKVRRNKNQCKIYFITDMKKAVEYAIKEMNQNNAIFNLWGETDKLIKMNTATVKHISKKLGHKNLKITNNYKKVYKNQHCKVNKNK